MIKQNWNIGSEERVRILQLHENATKNLYILSEQNPVQGPGTPNIAIGEDENYAYFISQPSASVGNDYVDWTKPYFVYARDREKAYQCSITQKDNKGRPMSVEVQKDKPLPDIRNDEFLFTMTKTSKKSFDYNYGNDLTKNAFLFQGEESSGVMTNARYFGVLWSSGEPITVQISAEGPSRSWGYIQNNNVIDFDALEVGSTTPFNVLTDVFLTKKGGGMYFSLVIPTLVTSYPVSIGTSKPDKEPTPDPIPEPPQPVPLGDKFMDNISTPTASAILNDPKFIAFKKFVESADLSKYVFDIQSSASKCTAGNKEANKANGAWKDDHDTYPDVTVDPQADQKDLGNLNLTKARAQNMKNFLVTNIPKMKDAKFRVIAQGSKGEKCGTEEENKEFRRVDLTVTKL